MATQQTKQDIELERIRRENDELRQVLNRVPQALLIKDRDSRFLYANDSAAAAYGVQAEALVGRTEQQMLPAGNDPEEFAARNRAVIDSGTALTAKDVDFVTSEGHVLPLVLLLLPVQFGGGPAVLHAVLDRSTVAEWSVQRDKLERKVVESQRLESLGVMAGGIAHDFNNLLVSVFAHADLADGALVEPEKASEHIAQLRAAAEQLSHLSRQMLAYSGRGPMKAELVDTAAMANDLLSLLRASTPANVMVETNLPRGLPKVNGDPTQLSQVLMNMVTNSAEAIGEASGTVWVNLRAEHFEPFNWANLTLRATREPGEYVCLEVRDDGPGMDRATRERIFDPFFTSKGAGRGLGLASVLGIARSHGGALQVDSTPGEGSRMRLWLPAARRAQKIPSERPQKAAPGPQAGHVLVVEDEPLVRSATAALLGSRGFNVHVAEDGPTALEVAKGAERVDVVLLDMTMPGPPTRENHAALRRLLPDAPILLTSGYGEPDVLKELLAQPRTSFLPKPYSTDELVERLRELLVPPPLAAQ